MKQVLSIALLALLSACAAAPQDVRGSITRAQLDTVDTPLILAEIASLQVQATLIPWGENQGVTTWRTGDRVSLAFEDGVLKSSRGLGDDVMASDSANTRAAITGQQTAPYIRNYTFLDGVNQTFFRAFNCAVTAGPNTTITIVGQTHAVRPMVETCTSDGTAGMTNRFWVGTDGLVWRSEQWMGDSLGYLVVERLVR